ncbi:MAG: hypothetical protein V3T58_01095 [Candidatus Hydrothermarchaeales archaeon]
MKKFRDVDEIKVKLEEVNALFEKGDLACFLYLSSYIEDRLKRNLMVHCLSEDRYSKEIEHYIFNLNLYNLIEISNLFGLITKETYTDLEIYRKFRNELFHDAIFNEAIDREYEKYYSLGCKIICELHDTGVEICDAITKKVDIS